jgi:putative flavoprotein involved in K+ transport
VEHHELDVRHGVAVQRISPRTSEWLIQTSTVEIEADNVIVATGYDREPFIPAWPGRAGFTGELIHSSAYRNAQRFAGLSVLVVGAGNSGSDIGVDLVLGGASNVWVSVRTSPQIVPRTVGGIPMQTVAVAARPLPRCIGDSAVGLVQRFVHGDLSRHGLPAPREGLSTQFQRADVVPAIDVEFVSRVKRGELKIVAAVSAFEGESVEQIEHHARRSCGGHRDRRGLGRLVGHLGVLDERGRPMTDHSVAGLYFAGYANPLSGNLRELGIHARRIGYQIARSQSHANQPIRQPEFVRVVNSLVRSLSNTD